MDQNQFFAGSFFLGSDSSPRFEVRKMQMRDPGAHEVLVKVMACGICGTDVHIYHGGKGSAEVVPPVVLGHEFSGIVVSAGEKVTNVKPGDHVALDPNMYCGRCRPCRMGKKQNCENLYALGVNTNGGFAEYCVCPDQQCFLLDPDVPFDAGAMAEPLACALHGIDRLAIREGETVFIAGGGTIGLIMVQLAGLAGAGTIILSEPVAAKREIALELGARHAMDPGTDTVQSFLMRHTGIPYADAVIECAGILPTVEQAFSAAGRGSRILLFGVPGVDSKFDLPLFDIYSKELTVMGSLINPDTHLRAVNLINSGKVRFDRIISHHYGLNELEQGIKTQMSRESVKVIIHPQE